ncbi:MAG: hypothetical protein HC888_15895 [Candidatus Competibacteraceae bacterium]|nr:hypothetical protein [Candidatus Competibacteraceae bacterium]
MSKTSIRTKLMLSFLLVTLVAGGGIGFWSVWVSRTALLDAAYARLVAVRSIKRNQVIHFAEEAIADISFLREERFDQAGGFGFLRRFRPRRRASRRAWAAIATETGREIVEYATLNQHQDVYLVDRDGNIVYSSAARADLGLNISDKRLSRSGLARAVWACRDGLGFADFSLYEFSSGPAAFLAYPHSGITSAWGLSSFSSPSRRSMPSPASRAASVRPGKRTSWATIR